MKNKGFTLIELLAVIVILAIITLIATPIIINIINDAREESYKRSVEMYGKAVEQAIVAYRISNPNEEIKGILDSSNVEKTNISYSGSEVSCEVIYVYNEGNIYINNCSVGNHDVEYSYGKSPLTPATEETKGGGNIPSGNYTAGDAYIIHIGGEDRVFFVLGENASDSTKVDLIMNRNVGSTVAWCADEVLCKTNGEWDNTKGPLTANAYLARQTSNWEINTSLPTYNQIVNTNNELVYDLPTWIYDYLYGTFDGGPWGYWTDFKDSNDSQSIWVVVGNGSIDITAVQYGDMSNNDYYGVRPVITIPKYLLG